MVSPLKVGLTGATLKEILVSGPCSRTDIAEKLGLSAMATSRIVRDLLSARLIEEAGTALRESGSGRRQVLLQVRQDGAFSAGIVLSAYFTEVAIVNATGQLVARRSVPGVDVSDGPRALRTLGQGLNNLIDELGIPRDLILGVGIAVAAHMDPTRTFVTNADYIGAAPFNVVAPAAEITDLPVSAENIVNALALAEAGVGLAKDMRSAVVVRSATTIGACILQNGEIIKGNGLPAGRIGHFHTIRTDLTCSCGRNDCLNCTASGWATMVRLGAIKGSKYSPANSAEYATAISKISSEASRNESSREADTIMTAAGEALADGLHTLNQVIGPQALILSGSMFDAPAYMDGIHRRLSSFGVDGLETASKLRIGKIGAARASAILPLQEKLYSTSLDLIQPRPEKAKGSAKS